jgi:hypothetical protein
MKKRNHFRRIQKKQYNKNQYKNPYFKKTRKIPIIPIAILVGVFVLAVLIVSFIFGFKGFQINNVDVSGIEHIEPSNFEAKTSSYINQSRYLFFSNRNKFLFSNDELQTHLEKYFTFESFGSNVKKQSLNITIEERTSRLLWKTGSKLYLVDLTGTLVREITKEDFEGEGGSEFSIFPIFVDRNNVRVKVGDIVMNEQEILNSFRFQKHLVALGIGFKETQIDRLSGKWTSIVTNSGYDVLFDFSSDVDKQAGRLEVLFRDTIKDPSKLKYIDLRFGDHIYYR